MRQILRPVLSRRAAMTAAAAAVGSVLAACARHSGIAPSQPATQEGIVAPKAPTEVRLHARAGAEDKFYEDRFQALQQQYPTIKPVMENVPGGEYLDKLTALAVSGTIGDVVWTAIGGGTVYSLIARNVLYPMDEFVRRDKFDLKQYYPNAIRGLSKDGKLWSLPFKSHPGGMFLYFNQTIFEQAGLQPPDDNWTLDQLIETAKKFVKDTDGDGEPDVWGYTPDRSQKGVLARTRSFGGELLDELGKRSLIAEPAAVSAITWKADTFFRHRVAAPPSVQAAAQPNGGLFVMGKLAMMHGFSSTVALQRQVEGRFTMFACLHPKGPAGVPGSDYEADGQAITDASKNKDAAWILAKFLTDHEAGIRLYEVLGGTIGGRPDVYNDPRILKDPIRKVLARGMENAQPSRPVHNARQNEYENTMNRLLNEVFEGRQPASRGYLEQVQRELQNILDQPL